MELIHVEKGLFELVQKEWDEMDAIGISHSQQTQKDVGHFTEIILGIHLGKDTVDRC